MSGRSSGSPPDRMSTGTPNASRSSMTVKTSAVESSPGKSRSAETRVAVLAGQVAAPDEVPDHHRPARSPRRSDRGRLDQLVHVLGDSEHGLRLSLSHPRRAPSEPALTSRFEFESMRHPPIPALIRIRHARRGLSEPQPGLLQDAAAVQDVVGTLLPAPASPRSRRRALRLPRGCDHAPSRTGCTARAADAGDEGSSG